jgi:hypothetical protein
VRRFQEANVGMLVWEAFVTGKAKGLLHHEDAAIAVASFLERWPELLSDIPAEPAMNHAASALMVSGFVVAQDETGIAGTVIASAPRVVL